MAQSNTEEPDRPKLGAASAPRLELAADAVKQARWEDALRFAEEARAEHSLAHDGLRDVNARMIDAMHRRHDQEFADKFCSDVYDESTIWYVAKAPEPASFRQAVETVAMLWHWHMTTFSLSEDRDKATFVLEPCGSGGRLINEGAYYTSAKRPLSLVRAPSAATFSESNFPSYCTHCADHNRGFLERGFNTMIFEGWTRAHRYGACLSHVFKRLDDLPEEFYTRIGVDRTKIPTTNYVPEHAERVFSDDELNWLATHPMERFREAVEARDMEGALELVDDSWQAWMGLHGAYRVWFTSFCNHLRSDLDGEAAAQVIQECAWWLVAHAIEAAAASEPIDVPHVWSRFWRSHGEPIDVGKESRSRAASWKIPVSALVDPDFSTGWSGEDFAQICSAIVLGAEREGLAEEFGSLKLGDGILLHELSPDQR